MTLSAMREIYEFSYNFVIEFKIFLPMRSHIKLSTVSYNLFREGKEKTPFLMTLKPIWYRSDESLVHLLILLDQHRDKLDLVEILATIRVGEDILM